MVHQYTYSRLPDHPYALEMVPLSKKDQDNLLNEAKATYQALFPALKVAVQLGSDGHIFNLARRHGSNRKSFAMWTTSALHGTIEEVAALYLDQSGRMPIISDAARSRRLYELAKPSLDKPLHAVSMRWSLWKPPSTLSNGRDVCFLEYMDSFVDPETGHRVWARSMRSVNHLCCPASQHPDGPVRTYMRVSGVIFRETDRPDILEHVTLIHVDSKGASNWIVQQAIAANKRAADSLNHVLRVMRQLNFRTALCSIDSITSGDDKNRDCNSCGDCISKWTTAKRCRFCDKILCKKCVNIRYNCIDASSKNHRMCLACAVNTGSVNYTSRSFSLFDFHQVNKPTARDPVESALDGTALSKSSRDRVCTMQSSVHSSCSTSMTDSIDNESREGRFLARRHGYDRQLLRQTSDGVTRSLVQSTDNMPSAMQEWDPLHPNSRPVALEREVEPSRPELIDLSYLSELVTPRAAATTHTVDIREKSCRQMRCQFKSC